MTSKQNNLTVVYFGTYLGKSDKPLMGVKLVSEDGQIFKTLTCFKKPKKSHVPGGIYTVSGDLNEDSSGLKSIDPKSLIYTGRMVHSELLATIKVRHESVETLLSSFRQSKKDKSTKAYVLRCLKPLIKDYKEANAVGKLAFEVRVLHYLRTGEDV